MKDFQKKKKGSVNQVQEQTSRETPQVNAVQPQHKRNKGRRERANHKRKDANQSNAIAVEEIILWEIVKSSRIGWLNCVPWENRSPDFSAHSGEGLGLIFWG